MRKILITFLIMVGCATTQPTQPKPMYTPEQLQLKQFRESVLLRGELPPELQNLAQLSPEQYRVERENLWRRLKGDDYVIKYPDWTAPVKIVDFLDELDSNYCRAKGGKVLGLGRFSCREVLYEEGWFRDPFSPYDYKNGVGLCQTSDGILFVRAPYVEGMPNSLYVTKEEIDKWYMKKFSKEHVGRWNLSELVNELKAQPDMTYIPLLTEVSKVITSRTPEGLLRQENVTYRVIIGRAIKLKPYEYLISIGDTQTNDMEFYYVVLCPPGYYIQNKRIRTTNEDDMYMFLSNYKSEDFAQIMELEKISAHFGISLAEAYVLTNLDGPTNLFGFATKVVMYLRGKGEWYMNYNFLGGKDVQIISPDTIRVTGTLTETQLELIRHILGPSQFDRLKGSGPWVIDATFHIPIPEVKYSRPELLSLSAKELIR
ncbi:MAG: hypothetical protein QXS68_06640 [Candidatus Methanomethylicaceae archaeon]